MADVIFVLNSDADTKNGEQIKYSAYHQVMTNASPYFQVMFDRNKFREGQNLKSDGVCEVRLPETDPRAFKILCDIFHMRNSPSTNKTITEDLLHSLATLVDRYDCLNTIQPWPTMWRQQYFVEVIANSLGRLRMLDIIRWLHISSILCFEDIFKTLTTNFLGGISMNTFNEPSNKAQFEDLQPRLQELITERFETCQSAMNDLIMKTMTDLEAGKGCISESANSYESFDCTSILIGNATLGMREVFGTHWENVSTCGYLPVDLKSKMREFAEKLAGPRRLRTYTFKAGKAKIEHSHAACAMDHELSQMIDRIYEEARLPLTLEEFMGSHKTNVDDKVTEEISNVETS